MKTNPTDEGDPSPPSIKASTNAVIERFQHILSGEVNPLGLDTGFPELDRIIGGLAPGKLVVIASRPGMGKTTLMLNIVEHLCFEKKISGYVLTGDLSATDLVERLILGGARVSHEQISSQPTELTKGDLLRIQRAAVTIAGSANIVDDTRGISIESLRSKVLLAKESNEIAFVAIDHLHLLSSDAQKPWPSRKQEMDEVVRQLKSLARELDLPVLVLAQLKRRADSRPFPTLSDLRESAALEYEADVIGLLHRRQGGEINGEHVPEDQSWIELKIAKNRQGQTGSAGFIYFDVIQSFFPVLTEEGEMRMAWDDHRGDEYDQEQDEEIARMGLDRY
ncbi:MAG: DnaB-like helicase C-terminal domain-containing protein [Verrucomicrobiota bacterium]